MSELKREQEHVVGVEAVKRMIDALMTDANSSFNDVASSSQYYVLNEGERADVLAYASEKGLVRDEQPGEKKGKKERKKKEKRKQVKDHEAPPPDLVAETAKDDVEDSQEAPPVAPPLEEKPVVPEKREKRPHFEFLGYVASVAEEPRRNGGGTIQQLRFTCKMVEHLEDGQDDEQPYPAHFFFNNSDIYRRLLNDPAFLEQAAKDLSELRKEIDQEEVKFFPDPSKKEGEEFTPKWVYTLNGKRQDEPFDLRPDNTDQRRRLPEYEVVPPQLIEVIKKNPSSYYRSEAYGDWFYRARAFKREEIIGRVWEQRQLAEMAAAAKKVEAPAVEQPKPAPVAATREAVAATPAVSRPEKASTSRQLWEYFGDDSRAANKKDMRRGVHDMVNNLSGLISTKEDVDKYLEMFVNNAMIGLQEQAKLGGKTERERSFPDPEDRRDDVVETVYQELNRLLMVPTASPEKDRRQESGAPSAPEQRPKKPRFDVILTEDEAEFLETHPEMAVTPSVQVKVEQDSNIVVSKRLEQGQEDEGMRELVVSAVRDSLDGAKPPLDDIQDLSERLTAYLMNYLSGPHRDSKAGIRFRNELLDIDRDRDHDNAVIRNYNRFAEVVRKLAVDFPKRAA